MKVLVVISILICLRTEALGSFDRARYDRYRVYNVQFDNEEQIKLFQQLDEQSDSISFMGQARTIGQRSIMVAPHRVGLFVDMLGRSQLKHSIVDHDLQESIDRNMRDVVPEDIDVSKFDWQHFFHLKTIYDWMDDMASKYPDRLSVLDMGTSTQGNAIKGVKIGQNPENKSSIFIESGIHSREWIGPATATYLINELLTSQDERFQALANNFNWFVFPSVNPDGYEYTFNNDRMWRKNCRLFETSLGVDLNRNFPDHWNTAGSSSNPCEMAYAGPSAASELETQRLMEFIREHVDRDQIKTYFALHSYGQYILFPNGYTRDHVSNYGDLQEFGTKASDAIRAESGHNYTSGSISETLYPASGSSLDWVYDEAGVPIAYCLELRGLKGNKDQFMLPAVEILPTASEALTAIRTIVEAAAEKGYYN